MKLSELSRAAGYYIAFTHWGHLVDNDINGFPVVRKGYHHDYDKYKGDPMTIVLKQENIIRCPCCGKIERTYIKYIFVYAKTDLYKDIQYKREQLRKKIEEEFKSKIGK